VSQAAPVRDQLLPTTSTACRAVLRYCCKRCYSSSIFSVDKSNLAAGPSLSFRDLIDALWRTEQIDCDDNLWVAISQRPSRSSRVPLFIIFGNEFCLSSVQSPRRSLPELTLSVESFAKLPCGRKCMALCTDRRLLLPGWVDWAMLLADVDWAMLLADCRFPVLSIRMLVDMPVVQ